LKSIQPGLYGFCRLSLNFLFCFCLPLIITAHLHAKPSGTKGKAPIRSTNPKDACLVGLAQYKAGNVASAIEFLIKCTDQNPQNRDAQVALANASLETGSFNLAVAAFAMAQALKPGDANFLASYLNALDAAGMVPEQLPVYKELILLKPDDQVIAEKYLQAVETADEKKYRQDYLNALKNLAAFPNATIPVKEKLAKAYLASGESDKAAVEYRILLRKYPESADYWAGLALAEINTHPLVASESYRKAALFTDRVTQRSFYQDESRRLAQPQLNSQSTSKPDSKFKPNSKSKVNAEPTRSSMEMAKKLFNEKRYAEAEPHFREACSNSKDFKALAQFGLVLIEVKKLDEAGKVLQKSIDMGNTEISVRYALARVRLEMGELDAVEAMVKGMAQKDPIDPEPMYWQGLIALKRLQSVIALDFFGRANRLKPMDGKYAEALAQLQHDKEDFKTASEILLLAKSDLSPSGRLLLGDCLSHIGEGSQALKIYEDMYQKTPSAMLLSRRMDLLVSLRQPDKAIALSQGAPFKNTLAYQFSLAKAHLAQAEAHIIKADIDQAVELMKKVLDHDEHNSEYHFYLGRAYMEQNRFKKARNEFVDALIYRSDYPEALYRKGQSQIKLKDISDAEHSFGELSQHRESLWKARGLFGLALVFSKQGKIEAVESHLERSITILPLPEALAFMSRIRLSQGRVEEAEQLARRALLAEPNNEEATVALANALAAAKRQNEAMELAERGLRARPFSCGLLVQSAKLTFESGKLDSALAKSGSVIKICPTEPMGYFYAGVSTNRDRHPNEVKKYFKSFKQLGGDEKLLLEK
jgi:tetratricopeptide (TPR) repeat protein